MKRLRLSESERTALTRRPRKHAASPSLAVVDAADTLDGTIRMLAPDLYPYWREYYPFDTTNERCDLVWPEAGLIVEVDGGRHAAAGGRHASDADYDKMNRLQLAGWTVLRFTPSMIAETPDLVIARLRVAQTLPRAAHLVVPTRWRRRQSQQMV